MACGLPIVAERVGGIGEYVTDECAILCAPKNINEIVDAVLTVAESKPLQQRMGAASRKRALDLDWQLSARALLEIYRSPCPESRTSTDTMVTDRS
jgi:glycosyltransferase involved in cell wall biosynthesis